MIPLHCKCYFLTLPKRPQVAIGTRRPLVSHLSTGIQVHRHAVSLKDRDKFFGRTVILAARIAAQATGGEILVSAAVKDITQSASMLRFNEGRIVELKGIAEPQHIYGAVWES